jgi:hypothetical protein
VQPRFGERGLEIDELDEKSISSSAAKKGLEELQAKTDPLG